MKKQHIGVFALILGAALAFGTVQESKSNETGAIYGRLEDGTWILVTQQTDEQYRCAADDDKCKAEFSSDPNQSGAILLQDIEEGVYVPR